MKPDQNINGPAYEPTDQGDQAIMPIVQPITRHDRERALIAALKAAPMTVSCEQKPLNIGSLTTTPETSLRFFEKETPMKLITQEIRDQLLTNWRIGQLAEDTGVTHDPMPVAKFFNPVGSALWLITEMVDDHQDALFGLCDLGQGFPELGYVSLSELEDIDLMGGAFTIERDLYFTPKFPISVYAQAATSSSRITLEYSALERADAFLKRERRRK